ncbi:hypothetical protein [Lentzea sp. NPDC060358]|uniref:hypothetical protein n=1 Tax=Lentzea sp. NPDC060358 TaxID=3347103 RepID=UPI00366264FB
MKPAAVVVAVLLLAGTCSLLFAVALGLVHHPLWWWSGLGGLALGSGIVAVVRARRSVPGRVADLVLPTTPLPRAAGDQDGEMVGGNGIGLPERTASATAARRPRSSSRYA